jgi:hypothetical protein
MTAQAVRETGIMPEAVIYNTTEKNGRITHWTGRIIDRRSMFVEWHAGPATVYGPQSQWPDIYTAEAFARDNQAGQRLAAVILGSSGDDNGLTGIGGSEYLKKAFDVVKSKSQQPQWSKWLQRKLDLAQKPLPKKIKKRKQKVVSESFARRGCKKCKVPGCTGFLHCSDHILSTNLNSTLQAGLVQDTGF